MFPRELDAWYRQSGEPLPEEDGRAGDRELMDALAYSRDSLARWGLLKVRHEYPDRVYPGADFLASEPVARLSRGGERLKDASRWRLVAYLAPRFIWERSKPARDMVKAPIAVASLTMNALKFVLNWPTMHSAAGSLVAGAAVFLAAMRSHADH